VVTIDDVARHAGVAPSTVSYVLSGKRSISQTTRMRVEHSVRVLGYHPHAGARALASSRSSIIALVVPLRPDMHVPILMELATSVVTSAREHEHDVLLLTNDEGPAGLQRVTSSALADALVLMDVELNDQRVPLLRQLGIPAVLVGFPRDHAGLTCIDLDFAAAGALCAGHLADQGHSSLALLGPPEAVYRRGTGFASRTLDGFREGVRRRGLQAIHCPCAHAYEPASRTITRLLREHPDVTGIVVQNEAAAAPLLDVLRASGVRVPGDVSIVAICADTAAEQASLRLSSVSIPAQRMGRQAVDLVMAKVRGDPVPEATLLEARLTVRDSSGPAPSRAAPTP
jgi:DNA-binding LacI/PurR family transcriptional regulator